MFSPETKIFERGSDESSLHKEKAKKKKKKKRKERKKTLEEIEK